MKPNPEHCSDRQYEGNDGREYRQYDLKYIGLTAEELPEDSQGQAGCENGEQISPQANLDSLGRFRVSRHDLSPFVYHRPM